jgi:hypothetical protein
MPDFDTGPCTLPDVGELSYNDCVFSPLFVTTVSGVVVKDAANRTTKYMEYTITADGYVTMPDDVGDNIDVPMTTMRQALTAQAGVLTYSGRGLDIVVNKPGGQVDDVAWGPIPELLEFQPLGAGRSAKVKWTVKTRIPEVAPVGGRLGPVLQFNEETSVSYDDAGFSTISIRGTLEIPLTRQTQATHTLTTTVDDFRATYLNAVAASIDLTRFRVTRREFSISRDKRTMEWEFVAEELPYMGLPPKVSIARGTFNFRPAKTGAGLSTWLCTLRVTYTVVKGQPRRLAWWAFLALLRIRMLAAANGITPTIDRNQNELLNAAAVAATAPLAIVRVSAAGYAAGTFLKQVFNGQRAAVSNVRKALLVDFSGDEGLYLDSKTVTFSATWRICTIFEAIIVASGMWRKVSSDGGNNWEISMQNISGSASWLQTRLKGDAIVDFGFDGQ